MDKIALVTGADRGLGYALTAALLEQGWTVFAGQYMEAWGELASLQARYPALTLVALDVAADASVRAAAQSVAGAVDHLDLLINNAGVIAANSTDTIRQPQQYAEMHRVFDVNALGPLRMVENFLPLMDRSQFKRLCFVSSEAGSIGAARRDSWYGYCMSKAALNMGVKILFNHLRPEGYTFRLYHPGWVRSYMSGKKNLEAHLEPEQAAVFALGYFLAEWDPAGQPFDEERLALRDYEWREWPW